MKILFINPPHPKPRDPNYVYPLGIASIMGFLESNGYEPKYLDLIDSLEVDSGWDDMAQIFSKTVPDLIGITFYSENRIPALKLVDLAKKVIPGVKIIVGGPHATFMYSQIIQNYPVDAVVIGEGEVTVLDMIRSLESGRPLEEVRGIALKGAEGNVHVTPARDMISDLDMLPLPAYQHFNFSKCNASKIPFQAVFSRGCPFRCSFCSESAFWQHKFRTKSISKAVDELEHVVRNFQVEELAVYDAILSADHRRVIEFCKEILSRNLHLRWGTRLRIDNITNEVLEWMQRAGCFNISYGVESGSEHVLKQMNKKISVQQVIDGFDMTYKAGITPTASIMVGSPGDNPESMWETDRLLKRIKPRTTFVIPTKIYPGTGLYDLAKEKGLMGDEHWLTDKPVPQYTGALNSKQVLFFRGLLSANQFPSSKKLLRKMNICKVVSVQALYLLKRIPFLIRGFVRR